MSVRILQGDCRLVLPTLPENSVHCVVTSPPYWGLRDYGVEAQTPDAHFATFPQALAQRCIMAGSSERGCCAVCGAPWERDTERTSILDPRPPTTGAAIKAALGDMARTTPQGRTCGTVAVQTLCWRPSCMHAPALVPCTVLDPFGGTGTVARVAEDLGRDSLLIELNPAYTALAKRKTAQLGLFASAAAP